MNSNLSMPIDVGAVTDAFDDQSASRFVNLMTMLYSQGASVVGATVIVKQR